MEISIAQNVAGQKQELLQISCKFIGITITVEVIVANLLQISCIFCKLVCIFLHFFAF